MSQDRLVELIKKQIRIEKNFVKTVDEQIKSLHTVAAKLLMLETQKDSEKHAMVLDGILTVIKQKGTKPLWNTLLDSYVDKIVAKRNLEKHIKTEAAMLENIKEAMKETKDEGIKLLLEHIGNDEKKHHEIMHEVLKQAYKIKP
ncbi:MAG: hypothetical protein JSV05_06910 [Candidatus Bathyarchaeota archaeon]|nr:MAG: hypothetical protein JSV05_06910 [Candidatus Bathyarchaeota archaeon]